MKTLSFTKFRYLLKKYTTQRIILSEAKDGEHILVQECSIEPIKKNNKIHHYLFKAVTVSWTKGLVNPQSYVYLEETFKYIHEAHIGILSLPEPATEDMKDPLASYTGDDSYHLTLSLMKFTATFKTMVIKGISCVILDIDFGVNDMHCYMLMVEKEKAKGAWLMTLASESYQGLRKLDLDKLAYLSEIHLLSHSYGYSITSDTTSKAKDEQTKIYEQHIFGTVILNYDGGQYTILDSASTSKLVINRQRIKTIDFKLSDNNMVALVLELKNNTLINFYYTATKGL